MTSNRFLKKTGKVVLYLLGIVILLIVLVVILINTNYGKRVIRDKLQGYLEAKLHTKVVIGSVNYSLPKWVELKGVYIEDLHKDTLLSGSQLSIDLDMWKLIGGTTYIRKIELRNGLVNITRGINDTSFNYQFVVDAFVGNATTVKVTPDTVARKLTIQVVGMHNVRLNYLDKYGGIDFISHVDDLDASIENLYPSLLKLDINKLVTSGLNMYLVMYQGHPVVHDKNYIAPKSWVLSANSFEGRDIQLGYQDRTNDMFYSNNLKHVVFNKGFLDINTEKISADTARLDSSFIKYIAPKPGPATHVDSVISVSSWYVRLNQARLNNDSLEYDDNAHPRTNGFDLSHLSLQNIRANTGKVLYSSDSLLADINQLAFIDKSGFELDSTHVKLAYTQKGLNANELFLKTPGSIIRDNIEFTYGDKGRSHMAPQYGLVAVQLKNSVISLKDLYAILPSIKQYLPPSQFENTSIRVNTDMKGTMKQLNIPTLQLSGLTGSVVNAKAIIYNLDDTKRLSYDITIFNSSLRKTDILPFLPAANKDMIAKIPAVFSLGTHLKGDFHNTTADFNIGSTTAQFKGRASFRNLDKPASLQYDLAITSSRMDKSFLMAFLPPSLLQSIRLPDNILLKGSFKGDKNNLQPNIQIDGSYGRATVKGYIHNFQNTEAAVYDLAITMNDFELGKLLMQDSILGRATLSGTAKGTGFNYKTMHSTFIADVRSMVIRNYNYQNIAFQGNFDHGSFSSKGSVDDPNLQFRYDATGNLGNKYPSLVATLMVDTVMLRPLHLTKDTVNASFKAYIRARNLDPRNLDLYAVIDTSRIKVRNHRYKLDSIIASGTTSNGITDISLRSPFGDLAANGRFDYNEVLPSLEQYINKYYHIATVAGNIPPQQITFNGVLKKHPLITDLMPQVVYNDIKFNGNYASQAGDSALKLAATFPYLDYQGYRLRGGKLNMGSRNSDIGGELTFDTLHSGGYTFYATDIKANMANDSLGVDIVTKDQKKVDRYIAGATIAKKNDLYTFSLKNNLLLNYQKWAVAPGNRIEYSPQGILVNNFILSNNTARISANSTTNVLNSPVDVTIDNFNIKDITSLLNQDTLLAGGILSGKFTISDFDKQLPGFTGNLAISKLQYLQQDIGDLKLFAQKVSNNVIDATLDITGNGNIINAKGNYYLNDNNNQFDANVNIAKLNMATVQPFARGYLQRASGGINGVVTLNGKFSDPHWNGELNFDTTRFAVANLGTIYNIDKQKIKLAYPDMLFNKFTVKDSTGTEMVVDGKLTSNSLFNYDINMDINAKDFILVNAARDANRQVYGFAAIDAAVTVSGNTSKPVIEGDISLNDKTDITLVMPESNINKDAARPVVRFIERDTFPLPEKEKFTETGDTTVGFADFVNYNLNINVTKNAAVTIIMDPSGGDEIKVQGDAQLNAGVDEGGNIILAGNYELNSGYYILNYKFLHKEFTLLSGSTISFQGPPMDAQVDITAEYTVEASAIDLLGNEIGGLDSKTQTTFNQKIPFRVLLYINGTMKKPELTFDIQLPDDNTQFNSQLRSSIENKLVQLRGDVAATNKQVFSLLLLNRFVGEQSNDFFSTSGNGFNDLARESVSKFLNAALSQISDDLIKGVDIDLNVKSYSDYSTGSLQQRTDLNVAITKTFMDNRLSISVGKNFGIAGQDPNSVISQQNGANSLPDVTINYKLTKDGKYLLRVYKKTQFEVILDGYAVETGVAFILTMDYDKFNELFMRKKKRAAKK